MTISDHASCNEVFLKWDTKHQPNIKGMCGGPQHSNLTTSCPLKYFSDVPCHALQ